MLFLYLFAFSSCARHAVLFAGSSTWQNYRHQADIFTMYQQLMRNGYNEKQITLIAYDDIATLPENPLPNQIFHTIDHKENVYPGASKISYRKLDCNAQTLYNVLKSLPTTKEDNVFIFYDNHGSYGTLGLPEEVGGSISAYDLNDAMNEMYKLGLYRYMLFGIEACFSGSVGMLLDAPNLAVITASLPNESSWSNGYDESLGTYLTNVFADSWLSNVDNNPQQTLYELFQDITEDLLTWSTPCWFGDESMKSLKITEFITSKNSVPISNKRKVFSKDDVVSQREASERTLRYLSTHHKKPSVRAKARLTMLARQIKTAKLEEALDKLVRMIDESNYDNMMNDKDAIVTREYLEILDAFFKQLPRIDPDDYSRFSVLKALAASYPKTTILKAILTL